MRRKEREITDHERILEIIAGCDVCRLGMIDERGAYIVPMNFGFSDSDGLKLYFHSAAEGKKLDILRKNSCVTFEMDSKHRLQAGEVACKYTFFYECVMGRGRIRFLEGGEKRAGLDLIMAHYGEARPEYDPRGLERVAVLELSVDEISAKAH